jgi:Domain of unknown function (DUF4382)
MNAQTSNPLLLLIRNAWRGRLVASFLHNAGKLMPRYVKYMQPNPSHSRFHDHKHNRLTRENTMKNIIKRTAVSVLAASAVVLAGCGGSGSGSGETAATGFLSLGVSDGPISSAEKVCITFNEIELKSGSERTIIIRDPDVDPPWKINLLDYQGTDAAPLLFDKKVPAGDYQWMRLGVDAELGANGGAGDTGGEDCDGEASYLVMEDDGGGAHNLYIPSGAETGLKLVSGFTVPANGSANFTAEWDLGKSITTPPGLAPDVKMKPVIRLVNNVEVGTLTGTVHNDLATADGCDPWVHVFDETVIPNADDSIASAMVELQENGDGSMTWNYTVGFLLEDTYKAAFTCNGTDFEPADGLEAPIAVGVTTTVNFEPPTP